MTLLEGWELQCGELVKGGQLAWRGLVTNGVPAFSFS